MEKNIINKMSMNELPKATEKDLLQLEEIASNWQKAHELLSEEDLADTILTSPMDFMLQFSNFQEIPSKPYVLYTDENGKQKVYDQNGKIVK